MTAPSVSKLLIGLGLLLVVIGALFPIFSKIPFIGKLPGDILIRRENFTFYFPLATCLLMSAIVTVLVALFGKK